MLVAAGGRQHTPHHTVAAMSLGTYGSVPCGTVDSSLPQIKESVQADAIPKEPWPQNESRGSVSGALVHDLSTQWDKDSSPRP